MKRFLSLLVLPCLLLSACNKDISQTQVGNDINRKNATSNIIARDISYGQYKGYLAKPKGKGPFPGVILIHEWWGLNDNIKWYARQFANQGYAALAVDLYNGEHTQNPAKARELATNVRNNMDEAFTNLQKAITHLKSISGVDTENIASVGWCFGGGWSYEMAKSDMDMKASVIYYGQFNPEDDLEIMRTNIIGHFGENDESIPVDDVKAFRANLQSQGGEHQIFIYKNEGHGFARTFATESAKTAWHRTLEFLEKQLK